MSAAGGRRLRVLMAAYTCDPTRGSEPGVGWNICRTMAERHDVWVLTRPANRAVIEAELARDPAPGFHPVYFDLPQRLARIRRGARGLHTHYYLWQVAGARYARRLHAEIGFDLAHHVTFGKCWSPSLGTGVPVPFLWGPVGGAEGVPKAFWGEMGLRGVMFEGMREAARGLARLDPLVRRAARRSTVAIAKTPVSGDWMRRLGAGAVVDYCESGISAADLARLDVPPPPADEPVRFLSSGYLLHSKGFHLGLRAFAESGLAEAEYWVLGDGPERRRLEALAARLGIASRVRFWGLVTRDEALTRLTRAHVLVHPSLHDPGGMVCLEAMAAARPVVCLDLSGPGMQVTSATGIKVAPGRPRQVVADLAAAFRTLAADGELRARLGAGGRERVQREYAWPRKGEWFDALYRRVVGASAG